MTDSTQNEDDMTANAQKVNNVGRPTVYDQNMIDRAKEYISGGYETLNDVLPTVEGLSEWLNVRRSTIYAWRDDVDRPEFSDIVEQLLKKQARMLLNGGLSGAYNANITKLVLNKHGYHDTQTIDSNQNVKIQQQISTQDAARMIDYMLAQAKQVQHDDQTTTIEHKAAE